MKTNSNCNHKWKPVPNRPFVWKCSECGETYNGFERKLIT